jgi:hypothetical protein
MQKVAAPISHADGLVSSGFSVIRGFAPHSASIDAARRLGDVDSVEGLDPVQTLLPRTLCEASPNTYSGNFGRSNFASHGPRLLGKAAPLCDVTLHSWRAARCAIRRLRPAWE